MNSSCSTIARLIDIDCKKEVSFSELVKKPIHMNGDANNLFTNNVDGVRNIKKYPSAATMHVAPTNDTEGVFMMSVLSSNDDMRFYHLIGNYHKIAEGSFTISGYDGYNSIMYTYHMTYSKYGVLSIKQLYNIYVGGSKSTSIDSNTKSRGWFSNFIEGKVPTKIIHTIISPPSWKTVFKTFVNQYIKPCLTQLDAEAVESGNTDAVLELNERIAMCLFNDILTNAGLTRSEKALITNKENSIMNSINWIMSFIPDGE